MKQHILGFGLALSIALAFVFMFSLFRAVPKYPYLHQYPVPATIVNNDPMDRVQAVADRERGYVDLEYRFGKHSVSAERQVQFFFYVENGGVMKLSGSYNVDLNDRIRNDGSVAGIRRVDAAWLTRVETRNVYVIPKMSGEDIPRFDRRFATPVLIAR